MAKVSVKRLADLRYDGRHRVGGELAQALCDAAKSSVGCHHSEPYQLRIRYACADIVRLRQRLRELEADIAQRLKRHQVGRLRTTIDGIGLQTAACIIAELGDPARFWEHQGAGQLCRRDSPFTPIRQAQAIWAALAAARQRSLAAALWMPTLSAIRVDPWLCAYLRLRAAGKRAKVAIIAAMHKLLAAIFSVARRRQPFVTSLGFPPAVSVTAGPR